MKAKKHGCIAKMNKVLAPRNTQLKEAMSLKSAPARVYVAIEPVEGKKAGIALLAASFCPFCGEEMPA